MKENCNQNDIAVPSVQLSESLATIRASLTVHAGPLPPPETVERYEMVLPGAFDRILTMAENDQRDKFEHNRELLTVYAHDNRSNWKFAHCGQVFGFATAVIFFSLLGYSMWIENEVMFGILFAAGAFAGLAQLVRSYQSKGENTSSTDVATRR
jgi:uncharacterized membrane protein